MSKKNIIIIRVFGLAIFIGSMYLLFLVDWKVALGSFILAWSINIENKIN